MSQTITLPHLAVGDLGWQLMRLSEPEYTERRDALVDRCFGIAHVEPSDCPPAWRGSPLQRWCWLVLRINEIECDPSQQKPLVHFGIDLAFASTSVREWVWAIS